MHPLVSDYHTCLEEVLTKLLSAEEFFNQSSCDESDRNASFEDEEDKMSDDLDNLLQQDVETVKGMFHSHYQFLTDLNEYSGKINDILKEGTALLDSKNNICSRDEKKAIEIQRNLLSTRFEKLMTRASNRQLKLHEAVMLLQQKQVDNLKAWLISAEDRLSNFLDISPDIPSIFKQFEDYKSLKEEVRSQQETVTSLSSCIVIVDDESGQSDFEDQLNALSEKWSHVIRFIEDRGKALKLICESYTLLIGEEQKFNDWADKLSKQLNQMERSTNHTLEPPVIRDLIKQLQQLESEMESQHVHYSVIVEDGQKILEHLENGSPAFAEIDSKIENLTKEWDGVVQRMENLGLALTKATNAATRLAKQIQKEQDLKQEQEKVIPRKEIPEASSCSVKVPLSDARVNQWQRDLENLSTWLGRIEDDLGLDDEENGAVVWEDLDVEEQQILLDDTESAIEGRRTEIDNLLFEGKKIITQLEGTGDNVRKLIDIVGAVEERWSLVTEELDRKRLKIRASSELQRISVEADAMKRALHSHQKWLQSVGASIETVTDLSKIEDQSRVRKRSMDLQKKKVDKMKQEIEVICSGSPVVKSGNQEVIQDIRYFINFWESVYDENQRLQDKLKSKSEELRSRNESRIPRPTQTISAPKPATHDEVVMELEVDQENKSYSTHSIKSDSIPSTVLPKIIDVVAKRQGSPESENVSPNSLFGQENINGNNSASSKTQQHFATESRPLSSTDTRPSKPKIPPKVPPKPFKSPPTSPATQTFAQTLSPQSSDMSSSTPSSNILTLSSPKEFLSESTPTNLSQHTTQEVRKLLKEESKNESAHALSSDHVSRNDGGDDDITQTRSSSLGSKNRDNKNHSFEESSYVFSLLRLSSFIPFSAGLFLFEEEAILSVFLC